MKYKHVSLSFSSVSSVITILIITDKVMINCSSSYSASCHGAHQRLKLRGSVCMWASAIRWGTVFNCHHCHTNHHQHHHHNSHPFIIIIIIIWIKSPPPPPPRSSCRWLNCCLAWSLGWPRLRKRWNICIVFSPFFFFHSSCLVFHEFRFLFGSAILLNTFLFWVFLFVSDILLLGGGVEGAGGEKAREKKWEESWKGKWEELWEVGEEERQWIWEWEEPWEWLQRGGGEEADDEEGGFNGAAGGGALAQTKYWEKVKEGEIDNINILIHQSRRCNQCSLSITIEEGEIANIVNILIRQSRRCYDQCSFSSIKEEGESADILIHQSFSHPWDCATEMMTQ